MDVDGAHTPSAADHAEVAAAAIVADLEQHAEALARQAHEELGDGQDEGKEEGHSANSDVHPCAVQACAPLAVMMVNFDCLR